MLRCESPERSNILLVPPLLIPPFRLRSLNNIKSRFREETFTRELIHDVILAHPELIRQLYTNVSLSRQRVSPSSSLTPFLPAVRHDPLPRQRRDHVSHAHS